VHHRIVLNDEDDTTRLAVALLDHLSTGDCILLEGPVGVGKSALARAIIQTQMQRDGQLEDVPSPTFTLVPERALRITLNFPDTSEVRHVALLPSGQGWDWIDAMAQSFSQAI